MLHKLDVKLITLFNSALRRSSSRSTEKLRCPPPSNLNVSERGDMDDIEKEQVGKEKQHWFLPRDLSNTAHTLFGMMGKERGKGSHKKS